MRNTRKLLHYCCSFFTMKMTYFMRRAVGLEMEEPDIRTSGHGFVGKGQGERMCDGRNPAWCNPRSVTSESGLKSHFSAFLVCDRGQVTLLLELPL